MALMLEVKVICQSGKSLLFIDKSGILKCYVKSAPEKGKANKEIINIIAKTLQMPKNNIEIISGLTSRKKLIKIETNLTYEQVLHVCNSGVQKKIF